MKKLLRNIALLLLPVVLYFGVFLICEPNNYFGLHKTARSGNDIMASLRQYKTQPKNHVILGDSRLAYFNMEKANKIAGVQFENLSYGGASLAEELDLLQWIMEKNPQLETVVFGLSFYTLNTGYNHNRMVVKALENPLFYMTNLTYNINMLETAYLMAYNAVAGKSINIGDAGGVDMALGGGEAETRPIESYVFEPVQVPVTGEIVQGEVGTEINGRSYTGFATYALDDLQPRVRQWSLNEGSTLFSEGDGGLFRLLYLIDECAKRNVEFIIVLPPVEDSIHTLLTQPYGIWPDMLAVIETLQNSPATVLDYEFTNRPNWDYTMFYDGFHPDYNRGMPAWTQLLFGDIKKVTEGAA